MAFDSFITTADSYLDSYAPTTKYGAVDPIICGYITKNEVKRRSVLRFDLSSLSGKTITSATLNLNIQSLVESGDAYTVYRLTQQGWVEADVTWNKYDSVNDWTAAGGDYTATDKQQFTGPTDVGSFDITGLVTLAQDALDYRSNVLDIIIIKDNETVAGSFAANSKENATEGNRPTLEVVSGIAYQRSVAGSQPAATGTLTRIKQAKRAPVGSQPAATGSLALVINTFHRATAYTHDGEYFLRPIYPHLYRNYYDWHDIGRYPEPSVQRIETNYRFASVYHPTGAYIAGAWLVFICRVDSGVDITTYIRGDDQDNAADIPNNDPQEWCDRVRTSAQQSWYPGSYNEDDVITTTDFGVVLREIVSRSGWVSGNAINIFIEHSCIADEGQLKFWAAGDPEGMNPLAIRPMLRILWSASPRMDGRQPAATGTLTRITAISSFVAGTQPSASGALSRTEQAVRSLTGTQPAASGILLAQTIVPRSVAGVQPASAGTLSRIEQATRTLTGTQPASVGVLTRIEQATRTLAGNQPSSTATLSAQKMTVCSIAGSQLSASGTLSREEQAVRALAGSQLSASGTLTRVEHANRALAGVQPAPTGTLLRQAQLSRTVAGAQPSAMGVLIATTGVALLLVELDLYISAPSVSLRPASLAVSTLMHSGSASLGLSTASVTAHQKSATLILNTEGGN